MPATLYPTLIMHVHDSCQYGENGHIITVSEMQIDVDVLKVVLNGPTTVDMMFMLCGGLSTFYPDLTLNHTAVRSQNGQKIAPDHSGYLMVEWDCRYEFMSFLYDNHTKWRLDVNCFNERCNFHLQATFTNEDHYPHIFQGLLYATACTQPYLVPVPIQNGVITLCTLQELKVNYWVHQRAFSATTACRCHAWHIQPTDFLFSHQACFKKADSAHQMALFADSTHQMALLGLQKVYKEPNFAM
ncbi:hypothetical protein DFJ58DRAFT_846201 [Suillus subalutaceus]|uniref:uncharacterized protein n=1 Tax=Suillus subalutaceus TaxID=48586 RepID=UPI001B87D8AA|nr:uncharacterized protein DFJ58DRAFT_846201 [Suillus subalutaceus]KAG1838078.1 hypothetical protein DFJ58DRAFT_846201 [Suillus subalutaceus]